VVRNGRACAQAYSKREGDGGGGRRASATGDVTPKAAVLPPYIQRWSKMAEVSPILVGPPSGAFRVSSLPRHATTARYSIIHRGNTILSSASCLERRTGSMRVIGEASRRAVAAHHTRSNSADRSAYNSHELRPRHPERIAR